MVKDCIGELLENSIRKMIASRQQAFHKSNMASICSGQHCKMIGSLQEKL